MTASLVDNKIKNEQSSKYDIDIFRMLLLPFQDDVLTLILFAADVLKLFSLTRRLVKIFSKVAARDQCSCSHLLTNTFT